MEGPDSGTDIILIGESSEAFGLVGDYNDNGIVDDADFTVWQDSLGTMQVLPNDVLEGTIGLAQYNQWVANFGNRLEPIGSESDFNADGVLNCLDIDALMRSIVSGDNDVTLDLTGDSVVDLDDRDAWLTAAATANGFGEPYRLGDVNLDGTVDAADLNQLGVHWLGEHSGWCQGNVDDDIRVNANDLNALGINWQQSIPLAASAAGSVPEPRSALLIALCAWVLFACRSWVRVRAG